VHVRKSSSRPVERSEVSRRDWSEEREVADDDKEDDVRGGSFNRSRFRNMYNTKEMI
jgi:hypothetical protein